jgi:hypothetical protein
MDDVAGTNAADSVIDKCEQIADTAADPELWKRAAKIVRQTFHRELSREQISADADKYAEEYNSFHLILLYIGTGVGFPSEYVFRTQMACMPWVQQCFERFTALSDRVIAYAVNTFWQLMVEKEGYAFHQPAHTLALLREAEQSYSLKEALRIVAESLSVSLSVRDRNWLYG